MYRRDIASLVDRISRAGCTIDLNTNPEKAKYMRENKCIYISANYPEEGINMIWRLLHEFGHHLDEDYSELGIREETAWENAEQELNKLSTLVREIKGFRKFRKSKVEAYRKFVRLKSSVGNIYEQTIRKYKEIKFNDGMAILFTPILFRPRLLIIGDNPAGSHVVWLTTPKEHDYYVFEKSRKDDYALANKMRSIFSSTKLDEILKGSVVMNRVFFSSKDLPSFRIAKYTWDDMRDWCYPKLVEVIRLMEPQNILAISIGCFNFFSRSTEGSFKKNCLINKNGNGILREGSWLGTRLFGIYHPTSRHTNKFNSADDWNQISSYLDANL